MRIDLFFIPTILVGIILYAMFHHVNGTSLWSD